VLTTAFYEGHYLFDVDKNSFNPPPNVMSGVISLQRNAITQLPCDEVLFIKVVKAAFNQRRKMLRNSLSGLISSKTVLENPFFMQRPEQLSVNHFIELTNMVKAAQ
jgi:16S rRNA (adenine1518-N6/adenine1519-N6)-dimethyltransferase